MLVLWLANIQEVLVMNLVMNKDAAIGYILGFCTSPLIGVILYVLIF